MFTVPEPKFAEPSIKQIVGILAVIALTGGFILPVILVLWVLSILFDIKIDRVTETKQFMTSTEPCGPVVKFIEPLAVGSKSHPLILQKIWLESLTPSELYAYKTAKHMNGLRDRSVHKTRYSNRGQSAYQREVYNKEYNPDQVDPPIPPWLNTKRIRAQAKPKQARVML